MYIQVQKFSSKVIAFCYKIDDMAYKIGKVIL